MIAAARWPRAIRSRPATRTTSHPLHRQQPDRRQQPASHRRIARRAREAAGPSTTMAVTVNNFSLEDHWNQGNARAAIAKGGWSVVVLQQGPSALARVPRAAARLRQAIRRPRPRKAGARTALYMVWPSKARSRDFDAVSESYALAARDVDGMLLPAGDAWREAWRRDSVAGALRRGRVSPEPAGLVPRGARRSGEDSRAQPVVGLPGPRGVVRGYARLLQECSGPTRRQSSPSKESAVPR